MSSTQASQHHHRSTTKTVHKPFKTRHATKSALKDRFKGKIEKGLRQSKHQVIMSKLDRRNQAKQRRLMVQANHTKVSSVFTGKDGAPRIIAVVPLCQNVNNIQAIKSILEAGDVDSLENIDSEGTVRRHVERFKQNVAFLPVKRNLWDVLDACRMADYVLFVMDASEDVDSLGDMLLKSSETQGISNVLACVQGLQAIEQPKKRAQTLTSRKSFITHFFPTLEKVNDLDSRQESLNILRILCSTTPKGVHWREDRSWMMVENIEWLSENLAKATHNEEIDVILTGAVRGKALKADRLVCVGDWGTFQVEKITAASPFKLKKAKGESMIVDIEGDDQILDQFSAERDGLEDLAPEDIVMDDLDHYASISVANSERKGVLIDDHHYYSEDEAPEEDTKPKRLPRGTSKYQAAWYIGDVSESGSDLDDVDEDEDMESEDHLKDFADGATDIDMREPTEAGASEYPQSEAFLDPSPDQDADNIAAYRDQRRKEAEEDLEFPDEIELQPNALARERLARYRGLKNLRTSVWDTEEDKVHQPEDWGRLLEISNYKAAKNRIIKETLIGGISPGTRVHVHLKGVSRNVKQSFDPLKPLAMYSLLRHEQKRTALHYSITLNSEVSQTLKSKEEILVQCGPRRFIINPIFSSAGQTPNNVHKFARYLHPGQTAVASFTGPLTWGYVPVLYFTGTNTGDSSLQSSLTLIGTGTSLAPSQTRVIAKRIVLTGHPFKIHRRVVTVRFMFFNAEDVAWFKALRLWTKRGRSGFIKESLGTHGYFKATFDGKINPMDAVAVSLYKRVWLRPSKPWLGDETRGEKEELPMLVDVK